MSSGIRVKFEYEGHRVKVKVTGTKKVENAFPQCKTLIGHNSGSIKDRVMRFACSMGFLDMVHRMM